MSIINQQKKIKSKTRTILSWFLFILAATILVVFYYQQKIPAGLQIKSDSDLTLDLYLNGSLIGITPFYSEKVAPGEYTLTLRPQNSDYLPFEKQITLQSKFLTVIEWHPASTPDQSWGIFYLPTKKDTQQSSKINISSSPDSVLLRYDGGSSEVTPQYYDLEEGRHSMQFSLPSYESLSREVELTTQQGIEIYVKLAKVKNEIITTASNERSGWDEAIDGQWLGGNEKQIMGARIKVLPTKSYLNKKEVLPIRSTPESGGQIVDHALVGSDLTYLGDESGVYYKVQIGQKTGWAEKQFLKFQ